MPAEAPAPPRLDESERVESVKTSNMESAVLTAQGRLFEALDSRDWASFQYASVFCVWWWVRRLASNFDIAWPCRAWVDPKLTCFDPLSQGALISDLNFHRFVFFDGQTVASGRVRSTVSDAQVRLLGGSGDAALVTCTRLVLRDSAAGVVAQRTHESRLWELRAGGWVCVHYHAMLAA